MGDYGYRESGSAHVGLVWWAAIDEDTDYVDAANEFWGLAFGMLGDGRPSATLIGPSLEPRVLRLRAGERGWGVELAAHVFVRALDTRRLLGEMRDLPTDGRWFELGGVRLPVPEVDALEELIDVLLRQGVLAADDAVAAALRGEPVPHSPRFLHRHTVGATGVEPRCRRGRVRLRRPGAPHPGVHRPRRQLPGADPGGRAVAVRLAPLTGEGDRGHFVQAGDRCREPG